jgi:hypothetical protein
MRGVAKECREGRQFDLQEIAVEEQQGAEGDVLCGGSDVLLGRKVCQISADLGCAEALWVAPAVEQNEAFDVMEVGFLGAQAEVAASQGVLCGVQQSGERIHGCALPWRVPRVRRVSDSLKLAGIMAWSAGMLA